jgi:excisionase family DNA binding protein
MQSYRVFTVTVKLRYHLNSGGRKKYRPEGERSQMQQVEQVLLRPIEAAKALGCSRTRVYELVQTGDLPHVRLGGTSIRIPRAAIQRLVDDALATGNER